MTTTKIASSKLKPPQDIWQACRYGDVKAVQYFVEQKGADVNQPDVFLETPLTYACLAGSTATISYLLQRGAISDPATIAGNRAHHAASSDVPCRDVLERHTYPSQSPLSSLLQQLLPRAADDNHTPPPPPPHADIELQLDDAACVPAHAWLLAARCPALATILQHSSTRGDAQDDAQDAAQDDASTKQPDDAQQHSTSSRKQGGRPRLRRLLLPPLQDTSRGIDRPTLHLLLQYIYCGHLDAPLHVLPSLRAAAAALGLGELVAAIDAELVAANLWQGLDGRPVPVPASALGEEGAGLPTRFVIPHWSATAQRALATAMDALWQHSAALSAHGETGPCADLADVVIHATPIAGTHDPVDALLALRSEYFAALLQALGGDWRGVGSNDDDGPPSAFGSPRPQHSPCSTLLHLSFEDGSLETLTLVLRWCYMGSLESALVAPLLRNVAVVEEALHAADMLLLSDMQVALQHAVADTVLSNDALPTEHVCRLLLAADAYAPDGPLRAACIATLARKLDSLFMLPPQHHERCMLEAFVLAVVPQQEAGLGPGPAVSGLERLGSRLVRHASIGGALGPSLSLRKTPSLRTPTRAPGAPGSGDRGGALVRRGSQASPFCEDDPEPDPGWDQAPTATHTRGASEDAIVPLAPSESGPPLATGPSLLLKGDSLQLTGLVTGALLRDLRAAYCGLHAGDDEDSLRDAAAHPNAREAFNELLMHFYHHAAMDG